MNPRALRARVFIVFWVGAGSLRNVGACASHKLLKHVDRHSRTVSTGPCTLTVAPPNGRWSDGEEKGLWWTTSVHFTVTPSPGLRLYALVRLYSWMIVQKYTSITSYKQYSSKGRNQYEYIESAIAEQWWDGLKPSPQRSSNDWYNYNTWLNCLQDTG